MAIRISSFSGEIPRTEARLLAQSAAQRAENVKLDNGALVPLRARGLVETLVEEAQSIYLLGDEWLSWPEAVDVVPAPVAANRLYVTGDGAPKLIADGVTYALAVPAPSTAPSTALDSGTPDPDLVQTILYAYTWVTQFDEESEPSPLSSALLWSPGLDVVVSGFEAAPGGRAVDRMRIYRSQTSALGETTLFFIAERAVSTSDFLDVVDDNPIQEALASLEYNQPVATLKGIVGMPNGMMAAFDGKRLYFCEPYRPHAWPEKYILTTDYEIVGLGVFGSSLAVMTTGQPYIVGGTSPDTMSMEKLELSLPCIAARGIVDLGYSIAYPSPDGLVVINSSGAQLASRALMTRDQWQALNPASFIGGLFSGRYLASWQLGANGGIIIIDLTGEQPFLSRVAGRADCMFTDIGTGALYMLDGVNIQEWDAPDSPPGRFIWRSKIFVSPAEINFGAFQADADTSIFPANFTARIIADGQVVATIDAANRCLRLPAGFLARAWEIEIESNCKVTAVALGMSPTELAA